MQLLLRLIPWMLAQTTVMEIKACPTVHPLGPSQLPQDELSVVKGSIN